MVSIVLIKDLCKLLLWDPFTKGGCPYAFKEGRHRGRRVRLQISKVCAWKLRIKVGWSVLSTHRKQFITKTMISTLVVIFKAGFHHINGDVMSGPGPDLPGLAQAAPGFHPPIPITQVTQGWLLGSSSCPLSTRRCCTASTSMWNVTIRLHRV